MIVDHKKGDPTLTLWGKTNDYRRISDRKEARYHPLLFHMLDVAAVAGLVWDHCLSSPLIERIARSLGPCARYLLVFLAGAHDIGKASPAFQYQRPDLARFLTLRFSKNDQKRPHGYISAKVLTESIGNESASCLLAQITGGHHGLFPRSIDLALSISTLGNQMWRDLRQDILVQLANIIGYQLDKEQAVIGDIQDPSMVPILAGLISIVDWIGSSQDFFPCEMKIGHPVSLKASEYWFLAQDRAREALHRLGWLPAVSFAREADFSHIFRGYNPNALQKATISLAKRQSEPYLMIIEAPMGQGKTEAALYAADLAMCRGLARGLYVALPTQATGNAMYERVRNEYLKTRGHRGKLNLQLVHGDALLALHASPREGELAEFAPSNIDEAGDVEAQTWFAARKRPLLAPFGVGTIDQSLLSVLQTRHWFVRMFGLAQKVLIFDEVHAYDAYMTTILERLLHWLSELDTTVILLSATLPEERRRALTSAYSGCADAAFGRYPRITVAPKRRYPCTIAEIPPMVINVPRENSRTINLERCTYGFAQLSVILNTRLRSGGCAAVICNTVNRSIEVYRHLRDHLIDTRCDLFHARTLKLWRTHKEKKIIQLYGKGIKDDGGDYVNESRPNRSVLVATQVIEQSLDLDFDIMFSETAPIDLLLQRMGRLHRHPRRRPQPFVTPVFFIMCDADITGPPPDSFGNNIEYIYHRYILLRTWLALRDREEVHLPGDIETLIEMVYTPSRQVPDAKWSEALAHSETAFKNSNMESIKSAARLLVGKPRSPLDLIEEFNDQLVDDDDPLVHGAIRAATREGGPSVSVVMIPADKELTEPPSTGEVRWLLDHSVTLNHRGLFNAIMKEGERPGAWHNNAHLRHSRLLRINDDNQARIGPYILTMDQNIGVEIKKVGGENA
ncbi:CRISPR-associated helicase Cas3' [bacterium]|nr:CRISPR-associated helicase Cas3' [candidate division CSSED10-310 bacterium]